MSSQGGHPVAGEHRPPAREDDLAADFRRLRSVLAARAARLGSRDPEAATQETLRRSLENPKSKEAVEYYLGEELPAPARTPDWPLDRLLAWLHAVLKNVVREERTRAAFRREVPAIPISEPADVSPTILDAMVERETRAMVSECFGTLDHQYRQVLELRMDGLKYRQIARRLGVSENTVATWMSRGIRELGRRIRKRMGSSHG
jgi:RNA polymerase sigma factor (sigma-70 family)